MNANATYRPNCNCHLCGKPTYRPPKWLREGRLPFCSRACWQQWNSKRDMSHLYSPESIEKRRQKVLSNPERYRYAGGRYIEPGKGYVMVRPPAEYASMARKNGYCLEHRLVMAQRLGRPLTPQEVVHHLNGIVTDNRLENLRLYRDHQDHYSQEHAQEIASENHRTRRTASYHLRQKTEPALT